MNDLSKYNEIRSQIKTGDLIEWRSNSPIGKAIRWVTGKNVNHTSGAIWTVTVSQYGMLEYEDEHRLYIGEAISNGFHMTFLSAEIERFDGEVYWLPLKPEYDKHRMTIAREAQKLEGRPYDYTSLVRNLWRRVPIDDKRPYCSEAWQIALIRANLLDPRFSPTGKIKHRGTGLRPGEFGRTGLFEESIKIL